MAPLLVAVGVNSRVLAQDRESAFAIDREVQRVASARVLWPGFDPLTIPLAVFTGEHTYLFRHPAPPAGFSAVEGVLPPVFVFDGRYPGVTANSSVEMGGSVTATLIADGTVARRSAGEMAAVAAHEAFHVHQRTHHPHWSANEGDLFLYPQDDARLLGLRRLESLALRNALEAPDLANASCWARIAVNFRAERFEAMDSAFSTYERRNELNEGLAAYIQQLAADRDRVDIPATGFHATAIRDRAYVIGPAIAFLLDRLRPSWQSSLEANDQQFLDQLLQRELRTQRPAVEVRCTLEPGDIARVETEAQRDVAEVIAARGTRRRQFDARSGWRVVVLAAEGQPLWPEEFDPLNVERVDGGILHSRLLSLTNDGGRLQAIDEAGADIEALTEGNGPHPLFHGIQRVTVAGLSRPEILTEDRRVIVRARGLSAEFGNATVQWTATEARIVLAGRGQGSAGRVQTK